MILDIYEKYNEAINKINPIDHLKTITRYHRVQGSREIWSAVKYIKSLAEENGFNTRIVEIDPGAVKGFMEIPVSWEPIDGFLEIRVGDKIMEKHYLEQHPTMLAAHSPSGEGCGVLKICRGDDCNEDVVLAHGYPYDLFLNVDADLIIYYDESRYHKAFPYTGLFLEPREYRDGKSLMTIPYATASRLINLITIKNREIQVCWKARARRLDIKHPVLIAYRGEDPGVLFISHICHPKPGAHDNASGSIANYIVLEALSKVPEEARYSSCHVWVPEYTGTVFLRDQLPWEPVGVINLDMVGSIQHQTGSTLTLVAPPKFMESNTAASLWFSIQKVFDQSQSFNKIPEPRIRYGYSPYTTGSDHDVFVSWGFDSSMLNEWPSKYYHTDMDDVETISSINLASTSLASLYAGYILVKKPYFDLLKDAYQDMVKNWYRYQSLKTGFSLTYLSKYLLKKPLITRPFEQPLLETPLSSRTIYRLIGRERYLKLFREISGVHTYVSVYAPVAEAIGLKDSIKHYKAEVLAAWSRSVEEEVRKIWEDVKSTLFK